MNRIEKLIADLCPDGVEWKKLGEIGFLYNGLTGKNKNDFTNGNAKYVTYMNVYSNIEIDTNIENYVKINENEQQNRIEYGDVLFTGSSETPDECGISSVLTKHIDEPLYLNSFCFGFRLFDKSIFLPGFLKYLFRSEELRKQIGKTANGVTRFNVSKKLFAQIPIPLPPLPIQEEIVKILDTFTELKAELEAELEARRKQYEYYRNTLLTPVEHNGRWYLNGKEVEWKKLGEVCVSIIAGGDLPKNYIKSQKYPTEEYPYPIYSNGVGVNALYGFSDSYIIDLEAVTISARGTIGYHTIRQPKFTPIVRLITLIPKKQIITTKFLNYILDITEIGHSGGSIPQLTVPDVKKIPIPIPPLSEQERIVAILDKFDALVNDISQGLPAELEARRKQYEYYRNRLLTFEPKQ